MTVDLILNKNSTTTVNSYPFATSFNLKVHSVNPWILSLLGHASQPLTNFPTYKSQDLAHPPLQSLHKGSKSLQAEHLHPWMLLFNMFFVFPRSDYIPCLKWTKINLS